MEIPLLALVYLLVGAMLAAFFEETVTPYGLAVALLWPVSFALFVLAVIMSLVARLLDWLFFVASLQKIHEDNYGELWRGRTLSGEIAQVLRCRDSQGYHYIVVHPGLERARQAAAWTYDMGEDEYCPMRV